MQFPVSVPNDGMVDLVIQGRVSLISPFSFFCGTCRILFRLVCQLSRTEMWKGLSGAEKGATFWQNKVSTLGFFSILM